MSKIRGLSLSGCWIDEAPDIGGGIAGILLPNDTVSYFSYAAPRLNFLAKCMRQCFGISSDLTIKPERLFFTHRWGNPNRYN